MYQYRLTLMTIKNRNMKKQLNETQEDYSYFLDVKRYFKISIFLSSDSTTSGASPQSWISDKVMTYIQDMEKSI